MRGEHEGIGINDGLPFLLANKLAHAFKSLIKALSGFVYYGDKNLASFTAALHAFVQAVIKLGNGITSSPLLRRLRGFNLDIEDLHYRTCLKKNSEYGQLYSTPVKKLEDEVEKILPKLRAFVKGSEGY